MPISRATFYRRKQQQVAEGTVLVQEVETERTPLERLPDEHNDDRPHIRGLCEEERESVLAVLGSERFADMAPAEIHATLLDEQVYVCSVATMYRLLRQKHAVRERRDVLRHPAYRKPELIASGPNQVWSWDITKLRGPGQWTYYYLYVIMDIFSRYVVGWCVAHRESAQLAEQLVLKSCIAQSVQEGQLTIHADRGAAMTSKAVAQLLTDLGVEKTHSRPHVSNDNPYSESQFKTLKYRPDFPKTFGCLEDARSFCTDFFGWYNGEHRHSGIVMLTPETVHYGKADQVIAQRQKVLNAAYASNPERFVRGAPKHPSLPPAAWINPPPLNRNDA